MVVTIFIRVFLRKAPTFHPWPPDKIRGSPPSVGNWWWTHRLGRSGGVRGFTSSPRQSQDYRTNRGGFEVSFFPTSSLICARSGKTNNVAHYAYASHIQIRQVTRLRENWGIFTLLAVSKPAIPSSFPRIGTELLDWGRTFVGQAAFGWMTVTAE